MDYDKLSNNIDLYCLLSLARKVHGPYTKKEDGRQIVIIVNDDGSRRTVSYPKFLMEEHLGRELDSNLETIDHFDSNFNNNSLDNLRIMPRKEHSTEDTRRVKNIKLNCDMCQKEFERSPRLLRDKSKKGVCGVFCSRQCAGQYSRKVQLKQMDKLPIQPYTESEYYKKKYIKSFSDYLIKKYAISENF